MAANTSERNSERVRSYMTFALAALAIIGAVVLLALGKTLDPALIALVVGGMGADGISSWGYSKARAAKKVAEIQANGNGAA